MDYMKQALSLAKDALGRTSPNPAVGAVIVKDGGVVGRGSTEKAGGAHAEVVALTEAGEAARGATIYVTLEPCCHVGRTPPCTLALIGAGIAQVHMATLDPNPQVSGKGKEALETAGIKTHLGEEQQEARELNESYMKYITSGLPFVTAKFAMSLDGKIASQTGESHWITGAQAREHVHELRKRVDAIAVGVNTVVVDDPRLTARKEAQYIGERQPLRIIVDTQGRTPPDARIFREPGQTIVATKKLDPFRQRRLSEAGVEVWMLPSRRGRVDLHALLKALGQREVTSLLVEGGGTLLGSFFDEELVDKVMAFVAPIIIGGEKAPGAVAGSGVKRISQALRLHRVRVERLGEDMLITGYVRED